MRTNVKFLITILIFCLAAASDLFANDSNPYPAPLKGKKIAVFIDNYYQIDEAYYTPLRLKEAGADVKIVSHYSPQVKRDNHTIDTDITPKQAAKIKWDGVVIIGGFSPLEIREDETVIKIIKDVNKRNGMVSAICHGVCVLVTADLIRGKTITGNIPRKVEFENAGATFIDKAPQIDGNIITAIAPADDGPYLDAMINWFQGGENAAKEKHNEKYLQGKNIAIVIDNRYDYDQINYPLVRLQHNGANVEFVAGTNGEYKEYRDMGSKTAIGVDAAIEKNYDAIILTTHWAADTYRRNPEIARFISSNLKKGTLIASVNWGHTALISADLCKGYSFATTPGMKNDIKNAGGNPILKPVHQDRNLITCATDKDLPKLIQYLVGYLTKKQ